MEYLFDRVLTMAPGSKSGIQRIVLAAFVVTIAWLATARADDILERGVRFHISAAPLASALIEFSTQSGIQVAVADADVAHLNSNGVNGTLPIRAALKQLRFAPRPSGRPLVTWPARTVLALRLRCRRPSRRSPIPT
jgi:hypothetical protein